jgi:hypothetical protein
MENLPPGTLPPTHLPNYDSRGAAVVACAVVGITVSTVAVALRFGSRFVLHGSSLWWDDWAVLVTLIFSNAFLSCAIYWTTIGLGRHTWMVPLDLVQGNIYINWAALSLYATTIYVMRVSAVLFYARLFSINRRFKMVLWGMGVLLTGWWFCTMLVPWSFCDPWSKNLWPMTPGTCVHGTEWHHAVAFINFSLDIAVLLLPMPLIWRLQMTVGKKVAVSFVFLLGYSSAFLSLARFIMIEVNPNILDAGLDADMSWDLVPIMFPSFFEAPVAIVALCGPGIKKLWSYTRKQRGFVSLFSSSYGRKNSEYSSQYTVEDSRRTAMSKGTHKSTERTLDGDNNSTTAIVPSGNDWDAVPMSNFSRNGDRA